MPTAKRKGVRDHRFIKSIRCRKLFGRLNYTLDFDPRDVANPNFIYGDNGTGKTTILRLIYSLLSQNTSEGNRTYVANVPFENFEVIFDDGSRMVIDREGNKLIGSYTVRFIDKKRNIQIFSIKAEPQPPVRGAPKLIVRTTADVSKLHNLLKKLDLKLLYVSHDREIRTTDRRIYADEDQEHKIQYLHSEDDDGFTRFFDPSDRPTHEKVSLAKLTKAVSDEIRTNLLERANFAQENINSIYLQIAKTISDARTVKDISAKQRYEDAIAKLSEIERRYPSYEKIKALSTIPFDEFRSTLDQASSGRQTAIVEVLAPFLEGTLARIDNIRPVVESVNSLLAELNSYFFDKLVTYTVISGFNVTDADGKPMDWEWLSSGERQLIFIFFATLLMKQSSAIVLIDEPELSLNMKWQRRIVSSLVGIVDQAKMQFLFATHAFEILAKFQERVQKLENKETRTTKIRRK